MQIKDFKKYKIPDSPGVYFFKKGKTILYIGKATSLRDRVKSYFGKDLIVTRGPMILDMIVQADKIDWQETDSVLEALILEAGLIKKYQPVYNTKEKSDKSFNYVCITKEKIPKVIIKRGREIQKKRNDFGAFALGDLGQGTHDSENHSFSFSSIFGPYTNGSQLREAMKIIRRIFPYMDAQASKKDNYQFYHQLGLTPNGVKEYRENIKNLKLFFQGKKKKIVQNLKKEMAQYAKKREFEKADEIKKKIFALNHINDIALVKDTQESFFIGSLSGLASPALTLGSSACERPSKKNSCASSFRIEAYDIAHMSGKNMVGVMIVLKDGEITKKEYKKFIIRAQTGANDTGALAEIIFRRLNHPKWGTPNLIVVDGGIAQINVANRILLAHKLKIPVVGVVKDDRHKAKAILGDEKIINQYKKSILLANSESHRFAINFYRQKSRRNILK